MNHQRQVIREAVVALLAAGGTAADTRVFDHPVDPRQTLPALGVVDVSEDQRAVTMPAGASRTIARAYVFEVQAEVNEITTYARTRDQLLADVERLIAGAAIAGVKSIAPTGYVHQLGVTGEKPIAVGRQRFEALYYTPQGDPATTL